MPGRVKEEVGLMGATELIGIKGGKEAYKKVSKVSVSTNGKRRSSFSAGQTRQTQQSHKGFRSWDPRMFPAWLLFGKSKLWFQDSWLECHELLDLGFYSGIV
jgi:hypothetical protein